VNRPCASSLGFALLSFTCLAFLVPAAHAQVDATLSYFVPLAGPAATPQTGQNAVRFFRSCPNNDGGSALPNNARIGVVLVDAAGTGIMGLVPYIKFNGGTAAQGFAGNGADSIIANSTWNQLPPCPDVTAILADAPTAADGSTQITLIGAGGVRDASRKWGHYDSDIPVYVMDGAVEVRIFGKLLAGDPAPGSYQLRIKSVDWTGGLAAVANQGEFVSLTDINGFAASFGINNATSYWRDFDSSGMADIADVNIFSAHFPHRCDQPRNP
jgi:hypothetical protein